MQRPEDEVSGLGGGEGRRDRLEVAHLAEEDHVRVLAKRGAQGLAEGNGVGADLALVDDALLVLVHELDRVLDREDVIGPRAVDLVDDRRQGGRLARAGRTGHEHEPARLRGELVQTRRQAELLERLDVVGDDAERRAERLALEEDVDAEAGDAGDRVGEVELALDLELLLLLGVEHAVEQLLRVIRRQRLDAVDALQVPTQTDRRGRSDRDVQVGGASGGHLLEQIVDGVRELRHCSLERANRQTRSLPLQAALDRPAIPRSRVDRTHASGRYGSLPPQRVLTLEGANE